RALHAGMAGCGARRSTREYARFLRRRPAWAGADALQFAGAGRHAGEELRAKGWGTPEGGLSLGTVRQLRAQHAGLHADPARGALSSALPIQPASPDHSPAALFAVAAERGLPGVHGESDRADVICLLR